MIKIIPLLLLPGFLISCTKKEVSTKEESSTKEYFSLPGTLSLPDQPYVFSLSSHPTPDYYHQEYLPAGQTADQYSEMVFVEVTLGDLIMQNLALAKAKEINDRKMTDLIAAYNLGANKEKEEVYLDFIMSEGEGKQAMAEWNVYRYKQYTDSKGRKGVAMFGWRRRAYGQHIKAFDEDLITNRKSYVLPFMNERFPTIILKE